MKSNLMSHPHGLENTLLFNIANLYVWFVLYVLSFERQDKKEAPDPSQGGE